MSGCTRPLNVYRSPSGKIFFTAGHGSVPAQLPCGQCIACRLARSREWATRCVHESKLHTENCFITLTYDAEHLPSNQTLVPKHLQDFFKRFRRSLGEKKIRFYACGEYGDKSARPHYHALIFGHDFSDKNIIRHGEFPLYASDELSRLWTFGISSIGELSFESAAYVARYCCKKVTGDMATEFYGDRVPEFSRSSNRPGIGADYFHKYYQDIATKGRVYSRGGHFCKPPRYYDKLASGYDVTHLEALKQDRQDKATVNDPWRNQQLDEFNRLKFEKMIRSFEDG